MNTRLTVTVLLALVLRLHAAPPELILLQQTYDNAVAERVTAPFEAALTALNTQYSAALDGAATEAKKEGKLPDVIAIEADKTALATRQPPPDTDDDSTPESLKKLRAIYRAQYTKLTDTRIANHNTFLPAYLEKLKSLETTLTKADRVDEAKEIMAYREGVAAGGEALAAVAATGASAGKPAAAAADDPNLPKADERKAAQWVLGVGGSIGIQEGKQEKYTLSSVAGLPKGKFQLLEITLDGKTTTGPVTAESLKVLAGLRELQLLNIKNLALADDDLGIVASFPRLAELSVYALRNFTGTLLAHLGNLKNFTRIETNYCPFSDEGAKCLPLCQNLVTVDLNFADLSDEAVSYLSRLPKLNHLGLGASKVSPEAIAQLKPRITAFNCNLTPGKPLTDALGIIGPKLSSVTKTTLGWEVADDGIAALKGFTKLTLIDISGSGTESVLDGLGSVPGLVEFRSAASFSITDAGLMKFKSLKKLKKLTIKSPDLTDAGIAAFKKARPDVMVTR